MDSIVNRLGLYEFFSVFVSGVIVTLTGDLVLFEGQYCKNMDIVKLLILSFLIGYVLHIVSSILDKKLSCFQFRIKASRDFLKNNNKIVKNTLELKEFQKLANSILDRKQGNIFSKEETGFVYQHIRTYVELYCQSDKEHKINAIYGMYRNLTIGFAMLLITYVFLFILFFQCQKEYFIIKVHIFSYDFLIAGGLLICVIVFLYQWHHYAGYRVRVMLRQYRMMLLNRNATEIRKDS